MMLTTKELEVPLYKKPVQEVNLTRICFDPEKLDKSSHRAINNFMMAPGYLEKAKLIIDIHLN